MSARRPLSIRNWFTLAVISLVLVPFLAFLVAAFIAFAPTSGPQQVDDDYTHLFQTDVEQWTDPAWQAELSERLVADNADVVLSIGSEEVFRSTADPIRESQRTVMRYQVPDSAPARVAELYFPVFEGPPRELRTWFVAAAPLAAGLIMIVVLAWYVRRQVVEPLAATSAAAGTIGAGDDALQLPDSSVREVQVLNRAFTGMAESLDAATRRRDTLEAQRKMFISAIAHDLRTPLFSLRGSLEALEQPFGQSPEQREKYLAIARAKSDQLEQLIADLFAYARLEYLDDHPRMAPILLDTTLGEIVAAATVRADRKRQHLSLESAAIEVDADPLMLTRAIDNVLDNAMRHTPEGGTIALSTVDAGEQVEIVIADSGPGFSLDDIEHGLEAMYRGDASRSSHAGGSGLGLAIAARIMAAHGGTISLANRSQGGAMVTLRLRKSHAFGAES